MFADDLRIDFYAKLKGQRVLVIVNYDVDAICACKILQALFRTDYISYTLVVVDFVEDLKSLFDEHRADEKYVIFINCGGTLDLVEIIEPEEDITFFILDSHRPIDVCNIYNDTQVVLLSKLEDSESVPEFCDIFRACKLKLWTFQGEERLHEIIPLSQCNQKFGSMDLIYRKEFYSSLVEVSEKYGLNEIVFLTFFIQYGYRKKYSAADYVYSLLALLQSTNNEKTKAHCFMDCLDALRQTRKDKLDEGIELGKTLFVSVFKQIQNALEFKQVERLGPFLFFLITQKFAQSIICHHPIGTVLLADFLLNAYSKTRRNYNKALASPLVICTPCVGENDSLEETDDSLCSIAGIPPVNVDSNKNFFGKAFEKAAEDCHAKIHKTYFDSSGW
ncbi:conserved hypothetical protein [Pediculus humanus corporis]|uniref:Cell division control protein 45 n=1 Tax=Pediculus humanus subsp. corporis TaxID=121224 RepID=E0VHQ1_PEDHC|nr:uncharacterized protein Phum_PHUM214750 [Pediculus humanus corporis]EEB12937.1 conserved hypothetical protein [Pediculus humanus corporis]